MSDVPSNLIPTRITQLPLAPEASEDSLMMIVYQGNNYQIRVGDLLSVAGVPTSRQVIAGTGLTGGGQLSSNVTLSIANGGVGSTQLDTTGVTAGSYGDSTNIPVFTVDANGRVTAVSTIAATITGYVPVTRQVIAGSGLTGGGALNNNVTLTVDLSDSTPQNGFQTGSAGVATSVSRSDHKHPHVDLSSSDEVTNILGLSHGGTAKSIVPNAGAIIWSGADGLYVSPAGTAGQVLVSGGTSAPTWGSAIVISDQPANVVYAGPASGPDAPTSFRALVNADLPSSGVTANTYGSSTLIPVITVNPKGVITNVSTSSVIGTLSYQGSWNASTNTPTLASSVGTNGYYYVVSVAGSTNLNGITDWQIGDWAIFNGSAWQKIDQTNTVTSVNGMTGAVNVGTVTSVAMTVPTGLSISGSPITSSGTLALTLTAGYSIPTTASQTNWDSAYTQRLQWDGGSTNLVAATGRSSLGGTTVGQNVFTLTNPSAITFPRFNADNTVSALDAATFRTAIGAGTGSGTVTTVSVVSANGFAGTVANATTTPAITLTTTITGILKGNATAISAATAGTDYSAGTSALATGILKSTTSTGALTIAVAADFPTLNQNTTGNAATATNIAGGLANQIPYQTGAGATSFVTAASTGYLYFNGTTFSWASAGSGSVTSVSGTGTVNGLTLTGTVTTSGSLTLGGTLSGVSLTTQVSGTLPIANGGTGSTLTAYCSLESNVSGTLPIANGGTGSTSTTYCSLTTNVTGTLPIANGGTGTTHGTDGGTF